MRFKTTDGSESSVVVHITHARRHRERHRQEQLNVIVSGTDDVDVGATQRDSQGI